MESTERETNIMENNNDWWDRVWVVDRSTDTCIVYSWKNHKAIVILKTPLDETSRERTQLSIEKS